MLFLSEKMKFFQIRLRTSIAFVCTTNPLITEKRRFALDESSLSFCLQSDMLTVASVIFSLCESDMKPIGFVIFYSHITWRSQIALG